MESKHFLGGYLTIRKSLHGWFPPFIYQFKNLKGCHRMVWFVPKVPEEGRLFPPWKFEGRVKWGDS
jgi:hypothetical protein